MWKDRVSFFSFLFFSSFFLFNFIIIIIIFFFFGGWKYKGEEDKNRKQGLTNLDKWA